MYRDESHEWPDPLASTGFWNIGAFALPASMLSACSAMVFALVAGSLHLGGAAHELFVLPFPASAVTGATAGVLAWIIVAACRHRPGRSWPRIWALTLACGNTAIAILGLKFHDRAWSLTMAVAGLSASLALAPRLLKLRPDSPLVQHVGPLSLLVLLLVVPSACAVQSAIAKKTAEIVDQRIRQFRVRTIDVNEVTSFDWSRMEDNAEAAAKSVGRLKGLSAGSDVDDAALWRSAAILRKDRELAEAMEGLAAAVVAGFDPDRTPRISDLKEPAVRWDAENRRWEAYTQFPPLSEITGSYHYELGRLFSELASHDDSGTYARLVDYRGHYSGQRAVLQKYLGATAGTWADNWVAFKVPDHGELIGRESAPLDDVLQAPFITSEEGTLAAGQLGQLTSLPLRRVKALAQGAFGCDGGRVADDTPSQRRTQNAAGCHCRDYDLRGRQYFRLDCYSYIPPNEGTGAELRIELRVVYESSYASRLRSESLPAEIYFHFLIPEGEGSDAFREKVMTALSAAVRDSSPAALVRTTDPGGSVANGFTIHERGAVIQVAKPKVVSLEGLTPEPKALMVRVLRNANGRVKGG